MTMSIVDDGKHGCVVIIIVVIIIINIIIVIIVIIAILSAGLILFAYDKWRPQEPADLSIAVLPFENMSSDPEQEYFSDGISEEILNLLAQIQPLKVIARTSSFSFKGKDVAIATIAEQLNVRHVFALERE